MPILRPVINKRRCSAMPDICLAIPACPSGAIGYVEDQEEPLGGRMVIDYARCDGCGACVTACCGEAIDMHELPEGTAIHP
jgi:Pyruvate/2-oxoacid:ferredoxin oxidoreductase delta subunit